MYLHHILVLWCDNISAIALASNPVFHYRIKHIEVDYHFVREKVIRRDLGIKFIFRKDTNVDILTKPLPGPPFLFLRGKLLVDSASCLKGYVETKAKPQSTVKLKLLHNSTKTASFFKDQNRVYLYDIIWINDPMPRCHSWRLRVG